MISEPSPPPMQPVPARSRRYQTPPMGPLGMQALPYLLVELWLLNIADLALTKYSIWLGFASESNGVMGFFLRAGTVPAAVFKVGIVTVGVLALWRLRQHRVALLAAVLLTAAFAAVVAYQAFWVASL